MDGGAQDVVERYRAALGEYLSSESEAALHQAYELGRRAVASNIGLLGMISTHQAALSGLAAQGAPGTGDPRRQIDAAGRFLSESLSPFEMLHLRNQEANAALRRMNELLEQEAKRVAHALHDQAGTLLATIYLELAEIARESPQSALARIDQVTAHLDQVREQLRRLSHEVSPPILTDVGVVAALQFLAKGVEKRSGLVVTVEGRMPGEASPTVNTTLYRVVQEALNNVTRHARATRASVRIYKDARRLHCLVRDNGVGFDVSSARTRSGQRGLGLIGMEERVRALEGDLQITSAPGRGTTIRISLPRRGR